MKRMLERGVSSDDVQTFVDEALVCVEHYKGTRRLYISEKGATVLTKTSAYSGVDWIAKTTWSKLDYTENFEKLVKELKRRV